MNSKPHLNVERFTLTFRNSKNALHRISGPANLNMNGNMEHWKDGSLHSDSGPAMYNVKDEKTAMFYYQNGKLSRDPKEGGAIVYPDGRQSFYVDGKLVT